MFRDNDDRALLIVVFNARIVTSLISLRELRIAFLSLLLVPHNFISEGIELFGVAAFL